MDAPCSTFSMMAHSHCCKGKAKTERKKFCQNQIKIHFYQNTLKTTDSCGLEAVQQKEMVHVFLSNKNQFCPA